MSCVCLQSLRGLLASLLPLAPLGNLRLPPAVETLNAHLASRAPAASGMRFNARLALSLPPIPLNLALVEQISATATATEQLRAAVGFNPAARGGTSGLSLAVSSLNINLAALLAQLLPLLPLLPAITRLSFALSMVASLRATMGIDLLAPGVALRINALLNLPGGAPAPAPRLNMTAVARANAYASLSAAANVFGGPLNLLPSLRLIASLRLPTLPATHLNLLALLAALLGLRANLTALGLNVSASANLTANLRLALQPLLALPPLNLVTPPAYPMALPTMNASFMASANAIASLNLNAALALRLPNLAPLTLMAALTANGGLGRASACGSSCPVGSRL